MEGGRSFLMVSTDAGEGTGASELRSMLMDSRDPERQAEAMKRIIALVSSGESLPNLLMPIIQNIITSKDHLLKKLVLLYWEVVPKHSPDGKLLPEFILVCNGLRNDLLHPNEYVHPIYFPISNSISN